MDVVEVHDAVARNAIIVDGQFELGDESTRCISYEGQVIGWTAVALYQPYSRVVSYIRRNSADGVSINEEPSVQSVAEATISAN